MKPPSDEPLEPLEPTPLTHDMNDPFVQDDYTQKGLNKVLRDLLEEMGIPIPSP